MVGRRGAAMHVVMAVVAVLVLLASTLVALSTMNLNLTTSYVNGQVALNEAEAGISRLIYALNDNPRYGCEPQEEMRGRLTPGFTDDVCGYHVTFFKDRGVPWSVNNYDGSRAEGYGGRTVPTSMVNAFSTGFCRGQYRTIEVVVERPPFPYAIATSGRIFSKTPLLVEGTGSAAALAADDTSRPGHVASNYACIGPDETSIRISRGNDDAARTHISGSVRSVGRVQIEPPAVVRGGVSANSAPVRLPTIEVTRYRNEGQEGVARITPDVLGAQELDIMYYCGHDLTITGGASLRNGFLYVQGNLVVDGGLGGVGAIVVDGSVKVTGDAALRASNRVALVARGDVTLEGTGNYLQGLIYTGGNLNAKSITVVGNVIANSTDRAKGGSTLERVRIVSNPEAAALSFTATSSTDVQAENGLGDMPVAVMKPKRQDGTYYIGQSDRPAEEERPRNREIDATNTTVDGLFNTYKDHVGDLEFALPQNADGISDPDFAAVISEGVVLMKITLAWQKATRELNRLNGLLNELKGRRRECAADDDACRAEQAVLETEISAVEDKIRVPLAEKERLGPLYGPALLAFCQKLVGYNKAHTKKDGSYQRSGRNINVSRRYNFDLNALLPVGDGARIVLWHVHHGRL